MELRAIVVTGYGINADEELAAAFSMVGAKPVRVHVADLQADPAMLAGAAFLAFPGGFSFGDHLGSGLVLANLFRTRLGTELRSFVADGGLVIGICNGFQALVKTGLLPDLEGRGEPEVSLVHNDSGVFICDWTPVRFEPGCRCVWTQGLSPSLLPIRHGEGRFTAGTPAVLQRLDRKSVV